MSDRTIELIELALAEEMNFDQRQRLMKDLWRLQHEPSQPHSSSALEATEEANLGRRGDPTLA